MGEGNLGIGALNGGGMREGCLQVLEILSRRTKEYQESLMLEFWLLGSSCSAYMYGGMRT